MPSLKAIAQRSPVIVTAKIFAAQDTDTPIFVADRQYILDWIGETHSAGDAAGTVSVVKAASGTATGSGTALHSTAFDLNSTADTPVLMTVAGGDLVAESVRTINEGQYIGLDFGGTLNDTYQGVFTLRLLPTGKPQDN